MKAVGLGAALHPRSIAVTSRVVISNYAGLGAARLPLEGVAENGAVIVDTRTLPAPRGYAAALAWVSQDSAPEAARCG
jgi:hypothetical protein